MRRFRPATGRPFDVGKEDDKGAGRGGLTQAAAAGTAGANAPAHIHAVREGGLADVNRITDGHALAPRDGAKAGQVFGSGSVGSPVRGPPGLCCPVPQFNHGLVDQSYALVIGGFCEQTIELEIDGEVAEPAARRTPHQAAALPRRRPQLGRVGGGRGLGASPALLAIAAAARKVSILVNGGRLSPTTLPAASLAGLAGRQACLEGREGGAATREGNRSPFVGRWVGEWFEGLEEEARGQGRVRVGVRLR
jgi:hypothetical protein